jgi:hypothetical protein
VLFPAVQIGSIEEFFEVLGTDGGRGENDDGSGLSEDVHRVGGEACSALLRGATQMKRGGLILSPDRVVEVHLEENDP